MPRLALLIFLIFNSVATVQGCETIIASNDPTQVLPSSWTNVFSGGSYATSSMTDNIYWQVSVEYPTGIGCSDQSLNNGFYTKRYCAVIQTDDSSTPDVDERQLRVIYGDTTPLTCPSGYSISSGQCVLIGECPTGLPTPTICDDGYPPEAGQEIGYGSTCDRPAVRECSDGSFVREDTGICSTQCTDYTSCYDYALENSSCAGAETFEFQYQDPQNFSFTCSVINTSSPDHPDNGGNGDGNPFNDPSTPTTGTGSTPTSSEIDPYSLAGLIGDELQDDFSNVERAIRDDLDQSKTNTNTLETAINDVKDINNNGFGNIEGAIRDGITSTEGSAEGVRQSIDTLGAKLDQLGNNGPCDPTQPDYYDCLNTPLSNLPGHSQGSTSTFDEANANFKARLDNAPVVLAFTGISNMLNLDNPQCPPFEITFPAPINETLSTDVHCTLMNTIAPIISAVMIIIYTVIGFRIFASA